MAGGMEELAAWPPAAAATVVAALGAAALTVVVAAAGGLWALLRWRRDVAREERDRAWSRFRWVIDHVCSDDTGRHEIGRVSTWAMYDMQNLCHEDAEIGTLVLALVTGRGTRSRPTSGEVAAVRRERSRR